MKLIINADDYGRSKGINYGVIEAHENGVLTSTTAMVNMPAIEHGEKLARKYPKLGIGIHFVLSAGRPLTNLKCIVDENGNFEKIAVIRKKSDENLLNSQEIKIEFEAQFEKFIKVFGRKPTHIDSHHHVHALPEVFKIVKEIANKNNLPVRTLTKINDVISPDFFEHTFYDAGATNENFINILDKISKEKYLVCEIMAHPGYLDEDVLASGYNKLRLKEIDILTSQKIIDEIKNRKFELMNYEEAFKK